MVNNFITAMKYTNQILQKYMYAKVKLGTKDIKRCLKDKSKLTSMMVTAWFIKLLQIWSTYARVLRQAEITPCSSDWKVSEM
jgi:hypothetical protein